MCILCFKLPEQQAPQFLNHGAQPARSEGGGNLRVLKKKQFCVLGVLWGRHFVRVGLVGQAFYKLGGLDLGDGYQAVK